MEAELVTTSSAQTERVGEAVGRRVEPGDVVLLSGDVGTGKTTLVRAACRALGVEGRVTSPSFTIGQAYEGRVPVSHVDLFRLDTLAQEDPALLSDYLSADRVTFVEWPRDGDLGLEAERIALRLSLDHLGGDRRRLRARGRPQLVESVARALEALSGT